MADSISLDRQPHGFQLFLSCVVQTCCRAVSPVTLTSCCAAQRSISGSTMLMNRSLQSLMTLSPVQLHSLNILQSASLFPPCISAVHTGKSQRLLALAGCPHKRFYHPPDSTPPTRHHVEAACAVLALFGQSALCVHAHDCPVIVFRAEGMEANVIRSASSYNRGSIQSVEG